LLVLGELVSPPMFVEMEDNLYDALIVFLQNGYGQIPIIDPETGLLGILRLQDLMEAYHQEISKLMKSQISTTPGDPHSPAPTGILGQ
jgi:chloride channel protein, CIC family